MPQVPFNVVTMLLQQQKEHLDCEKLVPIFLLQTWTKLCNSGRRQDEQQIVDMTQYSLPSGINQNSRT